MQKLAGHVTPSRCRRLLTAGVALTLLLAACGDDDGNTDDGAGATDAPSDSEAPSGESLLGPEDPATGDVVKVGFVTSEGGVSDLSASRETAQAVVEYANERLGGLAGQEIELVTCEDRGDGPSGTACANQFVEEDVVAVVAGQVTNPDLYVPILSTAEIPWIVAQGAGQQEVMSETSFVLTGGSLAIFSAAAELAEEAGSTNVVVFGIDVPAFTGLFEALGQAEFEERDIEVELVAVAPTTPDVTPQVAAGMAEGPQTVLVFGNPTLCQALLPAIDSANTSDAQVIMPGPCAIPEVFEAVGDEVVDGNRVFGLSTALGDSQEGRLFAEILATYAPDTPADATAGIGFVSTLGFIRAVNSVEPAAPLDASSVLEALRSATDVPLPGYPEATFTCDGSANPGFPALCSGWTLLATVEGGELTDFTATE